VLLRPLVAAPGARRARYFFSCLAFRRTYSNKEDDNSSSSSRVGDASRNRCARR
jgi:hypothetical protein